MNNSSFTGNLKTLSWRWANLNPSPDWDSNNLIAPLSFHLVPNLPTLLQDTSIGLEWLKFALDFVIINSPQSNRQSTEMDNLISSQLTMEHHLKDLTPLQEYEGSKGKKPSGRFSFFEQLKIKMENLMVHHVAREKQVNLLRQIYLWIKIIFSTLLLKKKLTLKNTVTPAT